MHPWQLWYWSVEVLDVRSPPEVEQHGTIPGAININVRTLEDTLALSQDDFENQVLKYLEIVDLYMWKKHLQGWCPAQELWFKSSGPLLQVRWAHPIWENFPFSRSGPRAVRAAWILEAHQIRFPIVQSHMLRKSVHMTQSRDLSCCKNVGAICQQNSDAS